MGMLSGLSSQLDPSINPWQLVEKYGRNLIGSKAGVEFGLATIAEWLRVFFDLTLPSGTSLGCGRIRPFARPDYPGSCTFAPSGSNRKTHQPAKLEPDCGDTAVVRDGILRGR